MPEKCKHDAGYDNGTTDCQLCGADMEDCYWDTQDRVKELEIYKEIIDELSECPHIGHHLKAEVAKRLKK
jgi:transcription elongation factor Elf1